MTTVLEYLVIAAAIGLVVFVIVAFVFGRGEQMAPLSPRTSPAELPEDVIGGEDVRRIRFSLAFRGYRMSDVDWTLERVADELDRLHSRVAELGGEPVPAGVGPDRAAADMFAAAEGSSEATGEPAQIDAAAINADTIAVDAAVIEPQAAAVRVPAAPERIGDDAAGIDGGISPGQPS